MCACVCVFTCVYNSIPMCLHVRLCVYLFAVVSVLVFNAYVWDTVCLYMSVWHYACD